MGKEEVIVRLKHVLKHAHNLLESAGKLTDAYSDAYPIEREVQYILNELQKEELFCRLEDHNG